MAGSYCQRYFFLCVGGLKNTHGSWNRLNKCLLYSSRELAFHWKKKRLIVSNFVLSHSSTGEQHVRCLIWQLPSRSSCHCFSIQVTTSTAALSCSTSVSHLAGSSMPDGLKCAHDVSWLKFKSPVFERKPLGGRLSCQAPWYDRRNQTQISIMSLYILVSCWETLKVHHCNDNIDRSRE